MADAGVPKLVPGTPTPPPTPLTRFRTPHIAGVARAFIASSTRRGDLVLHVDSRSGGYVAELLATGRRVLSTNVKSVALLWTHLDLNPVPVQELESVLTQLADTPKSGRPMVSHIRELYASRCPLCKQPGVAEWFAWERDAGRPYAKRVRCRECGTSYEGPTDDEDLAAAGSFPVDGGPAYHLALSRAAPMGDALRPRVAELVQCYTPRNLSILMDILYRLPRIEAPIDARRMLTGLVVDALDRGSSLSPKSAPDERPRTLRTPRQFLERNVWMLLEEALGRYRAVREGETRTDTGAGTSPAASLSQLLVSPEPDYLLLARPIHSLTQTELAGSVRALIFQVEPPDAPFLALSSLWATWLWGEESPAEQHTSLGRRRLDWEWYEQALTVALRQLRHLLHPEGSVLLVTLSEQADLVRAMISAAEAARLRLDRWISASANGYRFVLSPASQDTSRSPSSDGGADILRDSAEILRRRGEPIPREKLAAWCAIRSGRSDLAELDPTATETLTEVAPGHLWLSSPAGAEEPLADRLEELMLKLLEERARWPRDDLVAEIYRRFAGSLSPEPELVEACIEAYAHASALEDALHLRAESESQNRRAQAQQIRSDIRRLGEELGYNVARRLRGDIIWREAGRRAYAFRTVTTGLLAPHLLKPPPSDGRRCLILPDNLAELVALKLKRDPRLQALVDQNRWTFLKFGQAGRMLREVKERADMEIHLGLEPLVEEEMTQIPLPLEE